MEKTITIEGMACKHCVANVTRTLEALEGVAKAEVSLESKSAKISLNNELSDAVIKTAIEDAGYEVVAIK